MAAAVPISLVILLACSWRLFSYARNSPLERALIASVFTISVGGICGALCLVAGTFSPIHCAGSMVVAGLLVLGFCTRLSSPPASNARSQVSRLAVAACGALLLLGLGLRSPPMDAALAGRDQGTYMLRAAAAAKDGALWRTNPALAAAAQALDERPGPADIVGLYPVDKRPYREGVYEGAYRPGFYLADRSEGLVVPQFLHLFPALLGMTRWSLPGALTPAINLFISALWLLTSFCVGLRVFRRELPALAWTATLCLDPLAIWVGRNPLTEPLDALLWMTALLCLLRKPSDRGRAPLAAAFFLGVTAWLRGNMWLLAPIMLLPLLVPTRTPSKTEPATHDGVRETTLEARDTGDAPFAVLGIWWFLVVSSLTVHAISSFPYLHDELKRLALTTSLTPTKVVWGGGVATVAIAAAATLRHARSSRATPSLRRGAGPHRMLFVSAFYLTIGAILVRQMWLTSVPAAGLARLDLLWPAVTVPVLILAFVGGRRLVMTSAEPHPTLAGLRTEPLCVAMVMAIAGQVILYALPTLPQTGLFYYGRYLLPQLLPLAYGLCVAGLFAIGHRITRMRIRRRWEAITCVALVGWVASPLVFSPIQRIQEHAASRSLLESIASQIPEGSVVIAGGEGWLRAHTFNQVAGALEMEHDVTVLPYRTREAAFATAMELMVDVPPSTSSAPPTVFLLLNESTKNRPSGPGARRAIVDLNLPPPLHVEPQATYELFGHRLKRSAIARPTQALRNEIRLVLASVTLDPTATSRTFSVGSASAPVMRERKDGSVQCIQDDRGWTFRLPPMDAGPQWLTLRVPPAQRDHAKAWRVLARTRVLDAATLKETRAERTTLGPWLLRAPPEQLTVVGATASTCDEVLTSIVVSSLAPPATGPSVREGVPHHRITPPVSERGGYGQTHWTTGYVFNRFRLGASASYTLDGDSITLRSGHPLRFPPSALASGSYEVSLTLKGLDALDDVAAGGRILVELEGSEPLELALDDAPSAGVWTPTVGMVKLGRRAVAGLSVTLDLPQASAHVLLRDVALIPASEEPTAASPKLR